MIDIDIYKCGYCGACVGICPENALELVETRLNISDYCADCRTCTYVCPMGALK